MPSFRYRRFFSPVAFYSANKFFFHSEKKKNEKTSHSNDSVCGWTLNKYRDFIPFVCTLFIGTLCNLHTYFETEKFLFVVLHLVLPVFFFDSFANFHSHLSTFHPLWHFCLITRYFFFYFFFRSPCVVVLYDRYQVKQRKRENKSKWLENRFTFEF